MVGNARLGVSDLHLISPKTPAPQYQRIERRERNEGATRNWANEKGLALLLKPASPRQSNTESTRLLNRDTERGIRVLKGDAWGYI